MITLVLVERLSTKRHDLHLLYQLRPYSKYRRRLCSNVVTAVARPGTYTSHNSLWQYKFHYQDKNIAEVYRRSLLMQYKRRKLSSLKATLLPKEQH